MCSTRFIKPFIEVKLKDSSPSFIGIDDRAWDFGKHNISKPSLDISKKIKIFSNVPYLMSISVTSTDKLYLRFGDDVKTEDIDRRDGTTDVVYLLPAKGTIEATLQLDTSSIFLLKCDTPAMTFHFEKITSLADELVSPGAGDYFTCDKDLYINAFCYRLQLEVPTDVSLDDQLQCVLEAMTPTNIQSFIQSFSATLKEPNGPAGASSSSETTPGWLGQAEEALMSTPARPDGKDRETGSLTSRTNKPKKRTSSVSKGATTPMVPRSRKEAYR